MLAGLNPLELGRLRMSVGYGRHKRGRPLSPIEVGLLFDQARRAGGSIRDCAQAVQLDGTRQIARFLRIVELPQDIQHLIGWGTPKDAIGFSAAFELARLQDEKDQRTTAEAVLKNGLGSKEVLQVVQLRTRSGQAIDACIQEVLGMRPVIEKRYVFIGSIVDGNIGEILGKLRQAERDSILKSCIESLELRGASGRLGERFFTLVGDERFNSSMNSIGKENIENQFRNHIAKVIANAGSRC